MAEDKENNKDGDLELDKSGGKKKLIIIIVAVVVLLGGAAGGYFFFIAGSDAPATQEQVSAEGTKEGTEVQANPDAGPQVGSALYVPMPRPFRFNVPGAARDRFVEIRVQLLVRGGDNEENAKMHIPLIESTLLGIFSQANADDLATSAGKVTLKQQSLAAVQKVMTDVEGNKTIEKVLFTGFVMQ
ncbi:flagellar basal body-associated protein FliL [Colwellia sp. RSH04]|uniref:flagellar basal body-associated protein FliL n=1 Tax=Colwellia sp. RSH04 TaxID=2305464 RepID=UPI000E5725E6|nr:flagellar basal body-associated protein FliL [Colwellia sp. RSH04]RHW75987.1 flagellar basal body-associated protein FliL [Colwellia sp. RSH04]